MLLIDVAVKFETDTDELVNVKSDQFKLSIENCILTIPSLHGVLFNDHVNVKLLFISFLITDFNTGGKHLGGANVFPGSFGLAGLGYILSDLVSSIIDNEIGYSVAIQSDGKVLVGGTVLNIEDSYSTKSS